MAEHAHEAALAGLASDIAREIEAHDAFDCPEGWTYVRAANAIATRLVERFVRPAPAPSSQSERIAVLEAALRDVLMTGLNGGNNIRLAFLAAGGKALSDDLLEKAEASEQAVRRARSALAPLGEE